MKKQRILIAGLGLDEQDRGPQAIAKLCRDSGYEVIYTGPNQSPEQIVSAALQEAVDVIGLSLPGGADGSVLPAVMKLLGTRGLDDVPVFSEGTIPEGEIQRLRDCGVQGFFRPGASRDQVRQFIEAAAS